MVLACVVYSPRKAYAIEKCFEAICSSPYIDSLYVNFEYTGWDESQLDMYGPLHFTSKFSRKDFKVYVDSWKLGHLTTLPPVKFSQDQARLSRIVIARNMALDFAFRSGVDKVLFVDSDVVIEPEGVRYLLDLDRKLCGGYVPGRGCHSNVYYVYGKIRHSGDLIYCDHGTCGYMLIDRSVFSLLRFRWGPSRINPGVMLSEDPAFCEDWRLLSGEEFVIHKKAVARHVDDPANPLTEDQTASF